MKQLNNATMKISNYKKAVLAFILASIIWGAGPPIFKWSLQGISPITLAFFRFAIPVVILLPFVKHLQKIRIRDVFYFLLLGFFNCTLNVGLYFLGLQYASSINQPVIASSGPIIILIGSALFLHDKARRKVLLGNLIGLAGILFIVLEPVMGAHKSTSIFGNILFVLATIAASLGTLVSKRLANRYNSFTLVFWTFLIATLSFFPVPLDEMSHHIFFQQLNWHSFIGILFGGILSSLVGYGLFYWGLHYIKASETAIFSYIDPVAAVIIAAPLLHEYPTPIFTIGSGLVFLGIYIAEGRIHWHPLHKLF